MAAWGSESEKFLIFFGQALTPSAMFPRISQSFAFAVIGHLLESKALTLGP
jgi:hypothetical protein